MWREKGVGNEKGGGREARGVEEGRVVEKGEEKVNLTVSCIRVLPA